MLLLNRDFFSKLKTKTSSIFSISMIVLTSLGSEVKTIETPLNQEDNIIETTDHIIVVKNNSVVFDYLQTEEEIENPVLLRVIEQPKFGEVTLNEDQTFEYAPLQNLCEENDVFVYQMTVGKQVMKVTVSVEILCESITIFNGISTLKDAGRLEKFTILGVENFPNNSLYVFDDSGEEVFHQSGYTNDWNGIIESGEKHLEKDRMYYYVFTDGGGQYFSGYLQIN